MNPDLSPLHPPLVFSHSTGYRYPSLRNCKACRSKMIVSHLHTSHHRCKAPPFPTPCLSFITTLPERVQYSRFPGEETEAQRGKAPVPGYRFKLGLLTQSPPYSDVSHKGRESLFSPPPPGRPCPLQRPNLLHQKHDCGRLYNC